MNRRDLTWFGLMIGLVLLVSVSAPAFPQEAEPEPTGEAASSEEAVESILRQQEQLLQGQRFTYDPGGRRDPFRSLFEAVALRKGPRPKGVAGMLVAEIDLVGIVKDDTDGDVSFFIGSDNKGYYLRVGDEVYDGTLIAVDTRQGCVTFRQQVDDPRLIKPYRDVVKRLVPLGEESANE
jgi:hypothetical protein